MGYLKEDYSFHDIGSVVQGNTLKQITDVYDIEAIRNSIRNIFTIQKNEVPGHPEFGNPLNVGLFDQIDDTVVETFKTAIHNELELWEPRVQVTGMNISVIPENNRIIVHIAFIANLGNAVYEEDLYIPFNMNTSTFLDGRSRVGGSIDNTPAAISLQSQTQTTAP